MNKVFNIQEQVFWYLKRDKVTQDLVDMQVDVVIVGGGMAGLSAAQAWHKRGKKVVVLEQFYCGSGATGKSSGFVTPNAELSLTDFTHRYNPDMAGNIWNFISSGVEDIRSNIVNRGFDCDYQPQNTLVVASSLGAMKGLEAEHNNLAKMGYQTKFYSKKSVQDKIGSKSYFGGVEYENTFGFDGYRYCQEMKKYLQSMGVLVFEETPVLAIKDHLVITSHAQVTADYIVVCTDRFMPDLGFLQQEVYHAQTFVMASQVLSDEQVKIMFPDKKLMVWDTDLIYNYFRITGDNRLLLGGGDILSTYASQETYHNHSIIKKLTKYIEHRFPSMSVQFQQMWPGLMGISKDIAPVAGRDKDKDYMFYITAASGLPIAAALGRYSAENLIDGHQDLDFCFSPYRKFPISGYVQSVLGNKASFAISNAIKLNIP